ncbi:hypothetical protein KVR01_007944 [Diaporthe batatas]|uniref:uncharacterized protein n=1 Tax=Diaporthe batatas TaxID=748121 RepID=UPI001D056FFA|nr:uncharacterized protein KVR01_007944 [Diaporthe batatas]KAG8162179.1 hypothetical protein KVR01_007944 [Diaporthe batatas]
MLSAFERRQANEDNKLWRENAVAIRQLYQDKKKTLKEVKAIMENEQGFPVTPLSTWEVKLRELGVLKKLKAQDWSVIYQNICPRLKHHGKKEFQKPTVIHIHGTKRPWDKCWKEIRRNRALMQRHHEGPLPPLPSFVTIRTPSPELLGTIFQRKSPKRLHLLIQQLFQTTLLSLQPIFEIDSSSLHEQNHTSVCPTPDSVYKLCLQGIPFTTLLERASSQMLSPRPALGSGESQHCDNRIIQASDPSSTFASSGHTKQLESQLSSFYARLSLEFASEQLALNFDSHHYLSMAIYLLSNSKISNISSSFEVSMSDILRTFLEFVSRRLLSDLFQSQLLSIKAAWESLLNGAQELKNKEAFEFLINIGMHNEWLEIHHSGHEYLFSAARMDCREILTALLDRGFRVTSYPFLFPKDHDSIIVEVLDRSNLECAKLLVQHCDVNHEFEYSNYKSNHFAMFITDFDDTRLDHIHCLRFLLEQGGNVDYVFHTNCPLFLLSYEEFDYAVHEEIQRVWPISILDYVYYYHRSFFIELKTYSKTTAHFRRAIALWNLEQGVDALRQYLDSARPFAATVNNSTVDQKTLERKDQYLEILLAEQFLLITVLPEKMVLWNRVTALLEMVTNIVWLPKTKNIPAIMLYATACLATSEDGQHSQKGLEIMQWLLARGFRVNSEALLVAYEYGDIAVMQYLASFCDDIKVGGESVLIAAVRNDDLKSARLLLDIGVNPNSSTITEDGWDMNVFEAAGCGSTLATMKYLVQVGVKPRVGMFGPRPSLALVHMFHCLKVDDMLNKVQYIVEQHVLKDEPRWSSLPLLELCLHDRVHGITQGANDLPVRREIFNFLLSKGAGINSGSPLADWIATGGGHDLVQRMLSAGADPNAYSFTVRDPDYPKNHWYDHRAIISRTPLQAAAGIGDYTLVCLLLEHGADLNAPALGGHLQGHTALQAICAWDPVRREERLRKDKIVQLLLDKGAHVNAANSSGRTALMEAAVLGDISTAFVLLKYGATPNAISKEDDWDGPVTALDRAATCGRLDMVKFLLNANALSSTAWSNGGDYEGAIEKAKTNDYFGVSQLIQSHSAERDRWNAPSGMSVASSIDTRYMQQPPMLRTNSPTTARPQSRTQFIAAESPSSATSLDQTHDPCQTRDREAFESSPSAQESEAHGIPGAEVNDVTWPSEFEDVVDGPQLAIAWRDESRDETHGETGDQALHIEETSSGNDASLYEPTGQCWVVENQGSALLGPSRMAENVFMGFPGSQSP